MDSSPPPKLDLRAHLAQVAPVLQNWWEHGEQKNPCLLCSPLQIDHAPIPQTQDLKKFWTDVDFVISRRMALIDNTEYYGQAVPHHYVDFGASAMACMLGATVDYLNPETIWAHPHLSTLQEVLAVTRDAHNFAHRTVYEITRRSVALSPNHHIVAPYAMGGITDNIAGLYGTENLLMDMACEADKVKEVMRHMTRLWIEAFHDIQREIKKGGNHGGIGWAGIWAPGTTFPLQEDFSYMISPAMYREFCVPCLREQIAAMDYAMYHLDGVGSLVHLEALLEIPELRAIQWIPGTGREKLSQWYDVIKHILRRKKSVQVFAQPEEVDDLIKNVGARGMLITCYLGMGTRLGLAGREAHDQALALLERYGD